MEIEDAEVLKLLEVKDQVLVLVGGAFDDTHFQDFGVDDWDWVSVGVGLLVKLEWVDCGGFLEIINNILIVVIIIVNVVIDVYELLLLVNHRLSNFEEIVEVLAVSETDSHLFSRIVKI